MKNAFLKKRLPAWLLVAALLLTLLPVSAAAADSEYAADDAVSFSFSDSAITTADTTHTSAYTIKGTALSIKAAGTYILSGTCADGSVTVKKGTKNVTLVLNGLNLTNTGSASSATAPLVCNKSTGVTIVAAAGTTSTLSDSAYNNDESYPANEDAENAVLKCKDGSQVTITGNGVLNILANGKNGIKSGTTDAETDAANPRDAFLTIENLTLNITAAVNDAINAEQTLNILGGTLNIAAGDDAIHSDYNLTIGADGTAGPTIRVTECYEGIEAATVNICSGDISMQCSDDCINAANADLSGYSFSLTISGGKIYAYTTTGDGFDSNGTLTISGGEIEVWSANTSDNQPLDADSTIYITGGTVFAAGGSSGMGTKLSASQAYVIFGTSGGQQQPGMGGGRPQPGSQGGQRSSQTTSIAAGNYVNVKNSSGTVVYTTTAPCKTTYILFSAPTLSSSDTYSLATGTAEHTWDSGVITTAATCVTAGVKTYTCTDCGATRTESVPATGSHTWDAGAVTVPATETTAGVRTYTCTVCGAEKTEEIPAAGGSTETTSSFADVQNPDTYYYKAVLWAAGQGIANGYSDGNFKPNATCTRGQIVTFLWRACGSPEPESTENPFADVKESSPYYQAILWAVEQGITTGYDDGTFRPSQACTRGQAVTFLYRAAGNPDVQTESNPFTDVSQDSKFYQAILWASENGITTGYSDGTFRPNNTCTRGQIVTFLYRAENAGFLQAGE